MSLETLDAGAAAPANDTAIAAAVTTDATPAAADPAAAAATDPTLAKPTLDADLRSVWDKLHPKRDDGGKFAKRDAAGNEVKPAADGADATAADPAAATDKTKLPDQPKDADKPETPATAASTELPTSWSAEMKAKLSSLPPEHADIVRYAAQRDKESSDAISRAGQQIKAFEPIRNVVEQFSETFQRNGLAPHDGIARMLAVEQWLGKDPGACIVEIAKAYKVDLQRLTGQQPAQGSEPPAGTEGANNPIVSTLQTQLAETRADLNKVMSHLTAQQRSQIEGEKTALARQIAEFASEQKDGKPLRPHFEAVRGHMAALMSSGAAQTMEEAYEQASFAVPDIRNRILADQRVADDAKRTKEIADRAAAAKRSATVNVKSGTASGQGPKTMDDTLREVARKAYAQT